MDENNSTLQLIAQHLVQAIAPLRDAVSDLESFQTFMLRIGWQVDSAEYAALATPVSAAVSNALNALESLGDGAGLDEIADVITAVGNVYRQIAIASPPGGIDLADPAELASSIFELLLVEYLADALPQLYNLLLALGIIVIEDVEATTTRPGFLAVRFRAEQIRDVFAEPHLLPERLYRWGTDDLDFNRLAGYLLEFFVALRLEAYMQLVDREFGEAFQDDIAQTHGPVEWMVKIPLLMTIINDEQAEIGLGLMELPAEGTKRAGLVLVPLLPSSLDFDFAITDNLQLLIRADSDITNQFGVMFRPGDPGEVEVRYPFAPGRTFPDEGFGVDLVYAPPESVPLLGEPGGTRVQIGGAGIGMALDTGFHGFEFQVHVNIEGLTIVVSMNNVDSFLGQLFGGEDLQVPIPLALSWSNVSGVNFSGGAGLTIATAPHLEIGPLAIERFEIGITSTISSSASPDFRTLFGVSFSGELGPIHFVVESVGLNLALVLEEGNAGPFDITYGFKPPTGIGLSIDGGGFTGGGFLSLDYENERYTGMLELEYQETIALKAIGLLTTRLPDGSEGFSLLIIITAEFTPIQLGFGFTLNGVGGLLGLNRTARVERLRTGIKDNTLSSILFPENVVANADRIISDLRQVFPPQDDRFVFGPMAKIGWGTPTLITIELGLLIEVPDPVRVAILGVVKALLPDEEAKLLQLQVNFLGVIDFEAQLLAFDASIYDSKLLNFTLCGDMALRLSWGDNPNFLLTVGGFHPAYEPPPLSLPALARLSLQLLSGNNPRLTLETYFAITSNTVQFGARMELYAAAGEFNVYGFLSFDVLFQFNPFYFIAEIGAMLALRLGSSSIASISLSLTLEGTTPWRAKGTATLKLFWFLKIKVRFDKTFGEERDTRLDDVAVLPLLQDALSNKSNWQAQIPDGRHLLVSLKEIESIGDEIVAHPCGVLAVSQKVVPLNVEIQKFGNQLPTDGNRFAIEEVWVGESHTETLGTANIKEQFAPAQFFEKSDAEKLSSKSFERYDGGVTITGSANMDADYAAKRDVEYELFYIDEQRNRQRRSELLVLDGWAFNTWTTGGVIAFSPLSFANNSQSALAPDEVRVHQEQYAVVNVSDLRLVNEDALTASEAEAHSLMNEMIRDDPTLEGEIQVVPIFEVNRS